MKIRLVVISLLLMLLVQACGGSQPPVAGETSPVAGESSPVVRGETMSAPTELATQLPAEGNTPTSGVEPGATQPALPSDTPLPPSPTPQPTHTATLAATPSPYPTIGAGSWMLARGDLRPMAYVPAGSFWMGAADADANADLDEKPRHQVELDAFWIDLNEVSHRDYQACVTAGACDAPSALDSNGYSYAFAAQIEDAPVVNVTWYNARDYCTWAGKRLPTEAEWEKAAHGEDSRIYPWGDSPDASGRAWYCDGCVYSAGDPSVYDDFSRPVAVGSFPEGASPYGLFDMAGNVWEWVQDWYAADTYQEPGQVNPSGPEAGSYRIVRGGAWNSPVTELRTTYRQARGPLTTWIDVGFRCVMDDEVDADGQRPGLLYPGQPTETPTATNTPTITPTSRPTRTPVPPTPTPTAPTPTALPASLPLYALTFAGEDGRVYVVNSDGSGLTAITDGTVTYHSPAWSPVANTIAAFAPGTNGPAIWLMAPDGGRLRKLFDLPVGVQSFGGRNYDVQSYEWVGGMQWSPDGSRLAFQSVTDLGTYGLSFNLHVISSAGSGFVSQTYAFHPSWSPSNNQLAFVTSSAGLDEFSVVREHVGLAGDAIELCSAYQSWYVEPAWSPDGRRILCVKDSEPMNVLFSANPEATERLRLYEAPLIRLPTWSPAGDEIAFLSNDGILYAIRPDGSGLRVITAELTMGVASLAWSPDGTRLALATFDGELYVVRADGGGLVQVAAQLEPLYDLDWRHTLNGPPQWSPWPVEP